LASRSNNEWKRNAFVFKFAQACTSQHTHSYELMRFFYGSDRDLECPLQPVRNCEFERLQFPLFEFHLSSTGTAEQNTKHITQANLTLRSLSAAVVRAMRELAHPLAQ